MTTTTTRTLASFTLTGFETPTGQTTDHEVAVVETITREGLAEFTVTRDGAMLHHRDRTPKGDLRPARFTRAAEAMAFALVATGWLRDVVALEGQYLVHA